jgi:hypothetical protein
MNLDVQEYFLASATGNVDDCEDRIAISKDFVAVIDGATDKTGLLINGVSPGAYAAEAVQEALLELDPYCTATECVQWCSNALRRKLVGDHVDIEDFARRPSAVMVVLAARSGQIWRVGDCSYLVGSREYRRVPAIDRVMSDARAALLQAYLRKGDAQDSLRSRDFGRAMIEPLLRSQYLFRNARMEELSYGAIDGENVPNEFIEVFDVPKNIEECVLASDGYPKIFRSLAESEAFLRRAIAEDPLMIGEFRSTKGVEEGADSFDDRAYVKIHLTT